VGEKGVNSHDDVLAVQTLLKSKGFDPGLLNGLCGPPTISAIRSFQATFLTHPDGLVEPDRTTWLKLSAHSSSSADAPNPWTGDSAQWSQDKKLESMHPLLCPKVKAVLAALAARGFQPKIYFGWRSVAVQLKLFEEGNTKVKFSFHNVQKPDGTPNAYAADIIDQRFAWTAMAESSGFWKALGEEAKVQGLFWGGDWITFKDVAHVQLVDNDQLGQVKRDSGL